MRKILLLLTLACTIPLFVQAQFLGSAETAAKEIKPTKHTVAIETQKRIPTELLQQMPEQTNEPTFDSFIGPKGASSQLFYFTYSGSNVPTLYETTLGNVATATAITTYSSVEIQAMEFVDDVIYAVDYNTLSEVRRYGTIDPSTGEFTVIKTGVQDIISMAYNPADELMYVTTWGNTTSSPYGKIDLITGNFTSLGNVPGICYLTIDNSGDGYLVKVVASGTSEFGSFDVVVGTYSLIGTLGASVNYIQDISIDRETDEIYWGKRQTNNPVNVPLIHLDKSTGAQTTYGIFNSRFVESFTIVGEAGGDDEPCEKITNLNANVTGSSVALTWTAPAGSPTGYEILFDGISLTTVTSTSYNHTNVPSGTHSYCVKALFAGGCIPISECIGNITVGDMCNINFEMHDGYGDGWNNSTITVGVDGNSTYASITLAYGVSGTQSLMIPEGNVSFSWYSGSPWDYEISFIITDAWGMEIYNCGLGEAPSSGVFHTYTNTCTAPETATIIGTITKNTGGAAIEGALVAYTGGPAPSTVYTTGTGNYSIEAIVGYSYNVTVSAAGYNTITETYTAVSGGATKNYQMTVPVISVNPTDVDVTTSYGVNGQATVTLSNTGDGPLNFGFNVDYLDKGGSKAAWDIVGEITAPGNGYTGVATDGNYIYLSRWNASGSFAQYDMEGNFIETFTISGVGEVRDITYDGTYFYAGNTTAIIYIMDLANRAFIGAITSASNGGVRHCTYDPSDDTFWVGPWEGLYKISRSGAVLFTALAPVDVYGSAYDNTTAGGPYLLLNTQNPDGASALVQQYDIAANSYTSFGFDPRTLMSPGAAYGSSGGAFTGEFGGKVCYFASIQSEPNLVGIFELGLAGWLIGIEPSSGTIAAGGTQTINLTMDGLYAEEGEWHANLEFTSANPNVGEAVVDVTFTIAPPDCNSPTNLVATVQNFNNIHLTWTAPNPSTGLLRYNIYYGDNTTPFATVGPTVTNYTDTNIATAGTYCYKVRAEYENGCISLATNEGCAEILPCNPPTNLAVEYNTDCNEAVISWTGLGSGYTYNVYRGTTKIAENITTTSYTDTGFDSTIGHTWSVTVNCGSNESNPISINKPACQNDCEPVTDLTGSFNSSANKVTLDWTAPSKGKKLSHNIIETSSINEEAVTVYDKGNAPFSSLYSNIERPENTSKGDNGSKDGWITYAGANYDAIGTGGAAEFIVAARWTVADLAALNISGGDWITKINFVPYYPSVANFTLHIYQGATSVTNPGTLVYEQAVTQSLVEEAYNEVILTEPYEIDVTKELWVGYRVVTTSNHPAGCDAGPRVADKGDLMYYNGLWSNLYALTGSVSANWNVEAFVETPVYEIFYDIYREGTLIANNVSGEQYIDDVVTLPNGIYEYCVVAVHPNCESEEVCVDVTIDLGIETHSTFKLYPNPADDVINIEGINIANVTVYNSVGQLVAKYGAVNAINVASYKTGIYFFNITTVDGNIERVRVVVQ
ncbi:MAG: T9SS type A sorting domain-containing protein [Bacteroidales bacterium]|nr:T9SS type A sorting domain-containing protein [Bacteroidales bacterium]